MSAHPVTFSPPPRISSCSRGADLLSNLTFTSHNTSSRLPVLQGPGPVRLRCSSISTPRTLTPCIVYLRNFLPGQSCINAPLVATCEALLLFTPQRHLLPQHATISPVCTALHCPCCLLAHLYQ
ncbi:unnamed protein product [Protopolystoma xenopodis]|uniref:Uncharacterized protein n=1 Tax=Protopolystoma xenopodis TaxID=117903 RepID=A0A3S5CQ55_9PLAT|nr:unnamed protein product [Protopolystoma xenopodis]